MPGCEQRGSRNFDQGGQLTVRRQTSANIGSVCTTHDLIPPRADQFGKRAIDDLRRLRDKIKERQVNPSASGMLVQADCDGRGTKAAPLRLTRQLDDAECQPACESRIYGVRGRFAVAALAESSRCRLGLQYSATFPSWLPRDQPAPHAHVSGGTNLIVRTGVGESTTPQPRVQEQSPHRVPPPCETGPRAS
jgi:hypothetical protein